MKKVPCMKKPNINDIFVYREMIPCFDKAEKIITEEVANGNTILHIGDAGFMPDETYIVVDFASAPKVDYPGIKTGKLTDGSEYKHFVLSDNKGAVAFDFGRMKE